MNKRVAVVGGGAVGVTAAHDLAVAGADVVLYERDDLASGASGRAAGIVYDAFAEDIDATVAARAMERFRALDADGTIEFTQHPYVWFARAGDDRRAEAVRESVERMRVNGRDVVLLDGDGLAGRFPALGTVDVAVAALARDAGYLDPASYVRAMGQRAATAGVTVETGHRVRLADDGTTVAADGDRRAFDAVLVAAGAHSKRLLADVGVPIPMKPYRVQALVTDPLDAATPTYYDATRSRYARPLDGGLLVGDGTEERESDPDDYEADADAAFERASLDWVRETTGCDADADRSWAGLCTATPDRDPLLGPVGPDGADGPEETGLYVATGWHGHGFMRAPALGERIAGQILGGDGTTPFDPRRFDGDEEFDVVEGMTVEK